MKTKILTNTRTGCHSSSSPRGQVVHGITRPSRERGHGGSQECYRQLLIWPTQVSPWWVGPITRTENLSYELKLKIRLEKDEWEITGAVCYETQLHHLSCTFASQVHLRLLDMKKLMNQCGWGLSMLWGQGDEGVPLINISLINIVR